MLGPQNADYLPGRQTLGPVGAASGSVPVCMDIVLIDELVPELLELVVEQ
jgi:hypothetical protein